MVFRFLRWERRNIRIYNLLASVVDPEWCPTSLHNLLFSRKLFRDISRTTPAFSLRPWIKMAKEG